MGMFKDLKKMSAQGKEMQKQSGRRGGLGGMKDAVGEASGAVDQAMAMQAEAQLLQTGTPGQATIKAANDTGQFINMQAVINFDLEVSVGGGAPYAVTHRSMLPPTMAAMTQPGTTLQVKVDPADPNRMTIDWAGTQMTNAQQG